MLHSRAARLSSRLTDTRQNIIEQAVSVLKPPNYFPVTNKNEDIKDA